MHVLRKKLQVLWLNCFCGKFDDSSLGEHPKSEKNLRDSSSSIFQKPFQTSHPTTNHQTLRPPWIKLSMVCIPPNPAPMTLTNPRFLALMTTNHRPPPGDMMSTKASSEVWSFTISVHHILAGILIFFGTSALQHFIF